MTYKNLFAQKMIIGLVSSITSGLCVGYFLAWIRDSGSQPNMYARFIFLAICSYLAVNIVMLQSAGKKPPNFLRQVLVTVCGSLVVFITINLYGDLRYIIEVKSSSASMLIGALGDEALRIVFNVTLISFIALPVMCVAYFFEYFHRARHVASRN